ncbi:hypothetical protein SAMN05421820_102178 [Pedobacter steynii]|uniref:Uncharacterized protein n=1 Tax=Pedobacter steynii TaxID=430522 RepID=A0A1G9N0A1_9SPHI|nr:hypothetical protein SAMN05421820_102178 [Pedobacter steynii]
MGPALTALELWANEYAADEVKSFRKIRKRNTMDNLFVGGRPDRLNHFSFFI